MRFLILRALYPAIVLLLLQCNQKQSSETSSNHLLPGTNCKVTEVQWLSELEDSKHYRIYYNNDDLIARIVNLDSSKKEDPDHFSECFYANGKIQKISYTHYETKDGVKVPRKNVRFFEYFDNGLVSAVNVQSDDANEPLMKCKYVYDAQNEIITRICTGTMGASAFKDSTQFDQYTNGRPGVELQYVAYGDTNMVFEPYRLQNEYRYTYDANSNLIKKEFRRNLNDPFEIKFTATFDLNQRNPVAEIMHIIDEITLSWHENPNMHTRDMNKNFRTSTSFYINHSEKGPDGKRRNVQLIHTDTLMQTRTDEAGRVIQKDYYYKRNNSDEGSKQLLSIKFVYDCRN